MDNQKKKRNSAIMIDNVKQLLDSVLEELRSQTGEKEEQEMISPFDL